MNVEWTFLVAMQQGMIRPGDLVLAGVSGGADSVALLLLLHEASAELGIRVAAVHVNHAMRGEAADADQRFVESLAGRLGVACHVRRADPAPRTEEQARTVRHRLLRECANEAGGRIALAHTLDDQAETILMRLLRGSGRRGLSAMSFSAGQLMRPLLAVPRAALREWLAARGQEFREDETNQDESRLRNRIRARLLPLLEEIQPGAIERMARAARLLDDEDRWMDQFASAWLAGRVSRGGEEGGEEGPAWASVHAGELSRLEPALARRVARLMLNRAGGDPRGLPFEAVERLLQLARRPGRRAVSLDLPGGMKAGLVGFDLVVHRAPGRPQERSAPVEAELSVPGRTDLPELGLTLTARIVTRPEAHPLDAGARRAYLDADRLGDRLTVRTRRDGDRFHPLGAPGRRKLNDVLIDRGVPRPRRDRIPLIVGREGIAWVVGVSIGHPYRLVESTRAVVLLEVADMNGA